MSQIAVPQGPVSAPRGRSARAPIWLYRLGIAYAAGMVLLALIGGFIAPYGGEEITSAILEPPSWSHWLGTDQNGMDIFSRVIIGPRYDVLIGLSSTLIAVALGGLFGVAAGYLGGAAQVLIRFTDTLQAFPVFVLAMAVIAFAGQHLFNIILVVALIGNSPVYARIAYAQATRLREREFIQAASISGVGPLRILVRHVLPNSVGPVIAQIPISIGFGILLTASLSFVGVGIRAPAPEWGAMVAVGSEGIVTGQWWPSVFPGLALATAIFSFSLVGEATSRRFGATAV